MSGGGGGWWWWGLCVCGTGSVVKIDDGDRQSEVDDEPSSDHQSA